MNISKSLFKKVAIVCIKKSKFGTLRSSPPEVFCKKGVVRNVSKFTGKHLCHSLFFNKVAGPACSFIKKETLAQVFSCEFCEISKSTFSYRTPPMVASFYTFFYLFLLLLNLNVILARLRFRNQSKLNFLAFIAV